MLIGILFYWFSHDSTLYGRENCGPILGWARLIASFFIIGSILYGIIITLTIITAKKQIERLYNIMLAVHTVFYVVISLFLVFSLLGIYTYILFFF
jgi:hypothetical protein